VFADSLDVEAVEQVCAGEPVQREDILATLIGPGGQVGGAVCSRA